MSFMNVKPTQPELDALKKRQNFYRKGEKLLEIKREQLYDSLKKTLNDFFKEHKILRDSILEDYQLFKRAYEIVGKQDVTTISILNKLQFNTTVNVRYINRLGVDIPHITFNLAQSALPSYSLSDTPIHIDFLIKHLKETLSKILHLAELDDIVYHFALSYKKIERRINALDDIIIPKLTASILLIQEVLEDNQMEEFLRMKKIKEHLTKLEENEN